MPNSSIDLVYLIDDDLVYQAFTKRMIGVYQFAKRTLSFYDGLSAIRTLGQRLAQGNDLPDIILLDLHMPIMNGWEFLDAFGYLPKPPRQIFIYVITGSNLPSDEAMTTRYKNLEGYMIKPITEEDFSTIWENFYQKRKAS